jgi:hypothetical protein
MKGILSATVVAHGMVVTLTMLKARELIRTSAIQAKNRYCAARATVTKQITVNALTILLTNNAHFAIIYT